MSAPAIPADSTLGHLVGVGDELHRLELPAWFEQHKPKGRQLRWDARAGCYVPKLWRPVWDPLNLNWRSRTHHARTQATDVVRQYVATLAGPRSLALPAGEHLTVRLHYRPRRGGTRDGSNLQPLQKAAVDGLARGRQKYRTDRRTGAKVELAGLDLVPDDSAEYLTELVPAVLAKDKDAPALWLDVIVHRPKR